MIPFVPTFTCPHCKTELPVAIQQTYGSVGLCGCTESHKVWEQQHRLEMERRKPRKKARRR